ncbi:MAG: hypothetical protein R3A10_00800 [Caldilineaceae bacterium]
MDAVSVDAVSVDAARESTAHAVPSHRMLSVAEEELSRIILDIHDGPVQYLFTALSLLTGVQDEDSHAVTQERSARARPRWACC